jgi:hypothetical protein
LVANHFLNHVASTERDRGRSVSSDTDLGGKEDGMKTGLH